MDLKTESLESLCELVVDCPHSTPKWTDSGIVVLRNQNIKNGVLDLNTPSFTNEEDYLKRIKRAVPQAGDIVITREAPMGEVCMIPEGVKCCLGQRQVLLRPRSDVCGEYLFWALQSPYVQHQISWNEGTGTTVSNVRIPVLKALMIPRQFDNERSAAQALSSLADKIELNKQTNQTLEQMAQTLFKSWFVDFDPVFDNLLAKADFKLENLASDFPEVLLKRAQKRLLALDNKAKIALLSANSTSGSQSSEEASQMNIHQHFPSEFEHNEQLGWIPKGWEEIPVSKAIQVNPRTTLPKGIIAKFADMKSMPTSGYMVDEVIEKAFSGGAKFNKNDILLARITPCLQNGKTALVDFLEDDEVGFGSTEFIVLRENKSISYPFIACLAREENFRAHCMQSMVGSSGRQRVQNACFDDYYLALPKEDRLVKRFSELTKPNFINMTSNKLENQSLTNLRDTLLPKLISGEIKIKTEKVL